MESLYKRAEEIQKLIDEEMDIDNYGSCDFQVGVIYGVKHADKTMIEKACNVLDDLTEGRLGNRFLNEFRKNLEEYINY